MVMSYFVFDECWKKFLLVIAANPLILCILNLNIRRFMKPHGITDKTETEYQVIWALWHLRFIYFI